MKRVKALAVPLGCLFLSFACGCDSGPKSGKGLALPDGDIEAGKAAFVDMQCNTCHQVHGVELPPAATTGPVSVELGGKVYKVKNYGELVTSVINPSHSIARHGDQELVQADGSSMMANYNSTMTVQQVIDLVAFLQSRYVLLEPEYYPYPY